MRGIIKVKEWFYEKVVAEAAGYFIYLDREYKDGMSDGETLHVDNVMRETDKAIYVELSGETGYCNYKTWKTWIPKSVITSQNLVA